MIFLIYILPVIGIILGIYAGVQSPYIFPQAYSPYVAIGILACIDSVLGGIKGMTEKNFNIGIFISGFFGNALIAVAMIFIGKNLNIDMSIAAIVVYGSRVFQNFAQIRRFVLNKREKKDNI